MVLLKMSSPTTIVRRIRTVIIDAVERCPGGARTHVGEEVFKTISPAIAHSYAATAPIAVTLVRWIEASRLHVAPRIVFASNAAAELVAMLRAASDGLLSFIAATAYDAPSPEVARGSVMYATAVALAEPMVITACTPRREGNNNETTESLIG